MCVALDLANNKKDIVLIWSEASYWAREGFLAILGVGTYTPQREIDPRKRYLPQKIFNFLFLIKM